MPEGYIKLYRQSLENPIICKDADYFAVWCYLLLNATHSEYETLFNGRKITLQKGQLITGRKSIVKAFNLSESKVQRILKTFEIEQQIEQQTGNKNRLITVLNWDLYQANEQQIEQQLNNKRTTNEQQVNTNKNGKNGKNVKNGKNIPPKPPRGNDAFDTFWKAYPKKVGKGAAEKSFKKYKPSQELLGAMLKAIEKQKQSEQWQKDGGQYIPNPSTWLNQKRWEDETEIKANGFDMERSFDISEVEKLSMNRLKNFGDDGNGKDK